MKQDGQDGQQQQQQLGVVDAGYEEVLLQAVSAVVKPKLWGLPTAQPNGATAESARLEKLPAQVSNSMSLCSRISPSCVVTEGCGKRFVISAVRVEWALYCADMADCAATSCRKVNRHQHSTRD
jgi:hypothetical protein